MTSIGTAETAEDAEVATPRPSAISAVSAVQPALGPRTLRKKRSGIFHRKIAHFITAVVDGFQSPNQTLQHNARIGPAIPDGASPFDRALSSRKTACAPVRAWLTSDVGQKHEATPRVPNLPGIVLRGACYSAAGTASD